MPVVDLGVNPEDVYLERSMNMNLRRNGFTLIELLVVIAIIAMLLSIMMPALGKAKALAQAVLCMSNCDQLILASQLYSADNDEKTVPSWQTPQPLAGMIPAYQWFWYLEDYHGESYNVMHCPTAKKPDISAIPDDVFWTATATVGWGFNNHRLILNNLDTDEDNWGGLGYNNWLEKSRDGTPENKILKTTDTGRYPPSMVPVFGDCTWAEAGWVGLNITNNVPPPKQFRDDPEQVRGQYGWIARFSLNRHNDRINLGFLDGHAERVKVDDFGKIAWHKNWEKVW